MKTCTICSIEKEFNKFSKQKHGKFGYRANCKECARKEKLPGITDEFLLSRLCSLCGNALNSLTPYKIYCNDSCKQKHFRFTTLGSIIHTNRLKKRREKRKINREAINIKNRAKYDKNPGKYKAKHMRRIAQKLKSTLSGFDDEVAKIYEQCPKGSEVHHVIPLREYSHLVSGLHVPWNLIVLTTKEHDNAHNELRKQFGKPTREISTSYLANPLILLVLN